MKKLLIASLFTTLTFSASADVTEVLSSLAAGNSIEQIIATSLDNNVDAQDIVVDLITAQPDSVTNIILLAVSASPDSAAEIVQAAIEANPELAADIVNAAVEAGADADEMLVAALLGGANEEDIALQTAAGNVTLVPTLAAIPTQPGLGGGPGGGGITASPN